MQVDGSVKGEIHVEKTLVISESGRAYGDIYAKHLVVNGEFEGCCHAEKIEILRRGKVTGTIHSDDLSIEQGGRFSGVTHSVEKTKEEKPKEEKQKEDKSVVDLANKAKEAKAQDTVTSLDAKAQSMNKPQDLAANQTQELKVAAKK